MQPSRAAFYGAPVGAPRELLFAVILCPFGISAHQKQMLLWHTNVVGLYAVSALLARGLRRLCRRIAQGIVWTGCRSQKTGLLGRRAQTRQCARQLRGLCQLT